MAIFEQDFFAIRFDDGTYRTINYPLSLPQTDIQRLVKYRNIEDAKDAAVDFNKHGRKCQIVPITVTIKEKEHNHKDLLVYHFSHKFNQNETGWTIRTDQYMWSYWNIHALCDNNFPYDNGFNYGALTD